MCIAQKRKEGGRPLHISPSPSLIKGEREKKHSDCSLNLLYYDNLGTFIFMCMSNGMDEEVQKLEFYVCKSLNDLKILYKYGECFTNLKQGSTIVFVESRFHVKFTIIFNS